ncbi:MAG: hypothetical protein Q8755_02920, partial [Candidatus Phytoplasma australasiaticum]|nr:hypothetical protein [Candidatus Phytoplasma australasiaticum]
LKTRYTGVAMVGDGVNANPLALFLFITGMEALSIIIEKAKSLNIFRGLHLSQSGPVLSHLFYTNDVIFLTEWDATSCDNLQRILNCFELVSGLSINVKKSNLVGFNVCDPELEHMAAKWGCKINDKFVVIQDIPYIGIWA